MEMLHLKDLGPPQRTYGTIANSGFMPSPTRSYCVHEVTPEDTLAGLALKYDVTVQELRRTNSLWANDNVWPGQILRVPMPSHVSSQASGSAQPAPDTPSSASTSTTSSSTSGSSANHQVSPVRRKQSENSRKSEKPPDKDPTLQEYLSRLDRSIAERKEVTKDWERQSKRGSKDSKKSSRNNPNDPPIC